MLVVLQNLFVRFAQLISVISLLSADVPNTDSPANIDAAKQVREDLTGYKKKVRSIGPLLVPHSSINFPSQCLLTLCSRS
jgi:hypothetical protein